MTFDFRRLRPADRSLNGLFLWTLGWIVVPVLALLVLVFGSMDVGPAWNAAHGGGRRGTLVAQSKDCYLYRSSGYRCTGLYGTFASDDGSVRIADAFLDGIPKGTSIGDRIQVTYEGHAYVVYLAKGSSEWLVVSLLMLGALLGLIFWGLNTWGKGTEKRWPWNIFTLPETGDGDDS